MDINIKEIKQPYVPKDGDRVRALHVHPRDLYSAQNNEIVGREFVVNDDDIQQHMPGYWNIAVQAVDSEERYMFQALSVERAG